MDQSESLAKFSAGARVKLLSGSPWMTVLDVGRDTGQVWCRWMDDAGTVREGIFPPQSLWLETKYPKP